MSASIYQIKLSPLIAKTCREHIKRFPREFDAHNCVIDKDAINYGREFKLEVEIANNFDIVFLTDEDTLVPKSVSDTDNYKNSPILAMPREFLIPNVKKKYGMVNFYAMRSDICSFIQSNTNNIPLGKFISTYNKLHISNFGRDSIFNKLDMSALMNVAKYVSKSRHESCKNVVKPSLAFMPYD